MTLYQLLCAAKKEGYIFKCSYAADEHPDEADYYGTNVKEALEAMNACDRMWLTLCRVGSPKLPNWARKLPRHEMNRSLFFVPELGPEEQAALTTLLIYNGFRIAR